VAVRCRCRRERRRGALLAAARIPARYLSCSLDTFEIWDGSNPSLAQALRATREFVDAYPAGGKGILYMGPAGIGKTHLAVAALKEVVLSKGARGLYVNFLALVQELQMSFDGGGPRREEILGPVVDSHLVVLDELGAGKLSPWVSELVYYVVNSRYMARRITLVTTNYLDYPKAAGQESLEDRVTVPVRSRLFEMCELLDMRAGKQGGDYRQFKNPHGGRRERATPAD
jgi:DNA replication protein DnaC